MRTKHERYARITRLSFGTFTILLSSASMAIAQSESNTYNGTTVTYNQNDYGPNFDIRDARGVTTVLQYDNLGRVLSDQSAERGTINYLYDDEGNIIRQESEGGIFVKRDYDTQNRLIKEVTKQNGVERKVNRFSYDNCVNGEARLCKVMSDGHVTKYAYTAYGSIAKIATKYAGEDNFETTRYSYDEAGRAIKLRYPSGLTVRYHYSDGDYVTKVTGRYETGEDRETFVIAKNIQFNPESDRLTSLTYGNGLKSQLTYNANNKLETLKTLAEGEVIDQSSYIRNEAGEITAINRLNEAYNVKYSYDDAGQLILEKKGVDLATQSSVSYSYDAVGNRLSLDNGINQTSYTYAPQANRLDQINRKTLSYDERGNLTSDSNGKRGFAYDVTNRMVSFDKNGELKASYEYNAFGQRIAKTLHRPQRTDDSYRSLHFAYSPDGWLLSEFGKDNDKKRTFARDYVWLGARPLAQIERKIRPNGTTRKAKISFLHTDHLNTPRSASNDNGETVWKWESDAFGKGKSERDPDGDGEKTSILLRFPGQYFDRESGLYYNHHRDYDPALGRYIQSDPIGLKGGINRYAYVLGNPVSYIDPNGLRTLIRYHCTTTAIHQPGYGWVPGSEITKCSQYLIDIPEYDNLISPGGTGNDLLEGGTGGVTQVAGLDEVEEYIDNVIKNISCAVLTSQYLTNLEVLRLARLALSASGLDPNRGTFYAQAGVDGVIVGGLGSDVGVYFRADGSDYGYFASTNVNVGFDIDIGGAILYTTSNDLSGLSNVHELGAYVVDFFGTSSDLSEDSNIHVGIGGSVSPLPGGVSIEALSYTATTSCTSE